MSEAEHIISVAIRAGERIFIHAKGDPARVVAYGAAAVAVVGGTAVIYGSYVYGRRFLEWVQGRS